MELSYERRFIFVHIYRVAGQSISAAIRPYCANPAGRLMRVPGLRTIARRQIAAKRRLWEHNWGHITAKELRDALPNDVFDTFFKFAFVRNPWAWQVSVYHYQLQNRRHPDHELTVRLGSFERFLDWRVNHDRPDLQTNFLLSDEGELLVDFVGHYETLADDFALVCRRIGIAPTLPHRNASSHADFRSYYTDATRALVADVYRRDIEFLGYEFDADRPLAPLRADATGVQR
jgi:hypothetical protein